MVRLVTVHDSWLLPEPLKRAPTAETYLFVVLKEDTENYLLEMPPGGGGIHQSGHPNCWWVSKTVCRAAYKKGQRWRHLDKLIIELTADNAANGIVVQLLSSNTIYRMKENLPGPTIESYAEGWTYLRGQDSPQE